MTSLSFMRRVLVGVILTLYSVSGAAAQSGDDFRERLESAYEHGGLASLIEQNRLSVKPVVHALIAESIEAELVGDREVAEEKRTIAHSVASAFEKLFGETSLVEAVSYLDEWSMDEKRAKVLADSLHDVATDQRAAAESRGEALENYMAALATYRRIGDRVGTATTLGGIGFVYWYLDNADSTLAYIEAGLNARREVDDRELLGNSLNDMGSASRAFLGDYQGAAEYYEQAIDVRQAIGDSVDLARSYSYAAVTYDILGEPVKSLPLYDRSIEIAVALSDGDLEATSLHNSGVALTNLGRLSQAVDRFERAAAIHRDSGDDDGLIDALNMAGETHRRLGDFQAAIERYQDVITIAEGTDDQGALAESYLNMGVVLDHAERIEQANTYYRKALPIFRALGDQAGELLVLTGLSNTHLAVDDYNGAKAYAQEVLGIARTRGAKSEISRALSTLANAQIYVDEGQDALANYEQALSIARDLENPELIWIALMGFGEYYERRQDYPEAIRYYRQAIEKTEAVRQALQTAQDRSGYASQVRYVYENMIHLLAEMHEASPDAGYGREAFELLERAKARSFLELLSESDLNLEDRVNPELLARQNELVAQIGAIQRRIQEAAANSEADLDSLRALRGELEEEYALLQREIRLDSPAYASIRYPQPSGLEELQQALKGESLVVLQYAVGDSSSVLWSVTANEAQMYRIPNREALREQVEILRYALTNPHSGADAFVSPALQLYRSLVAPAEEVVSRSERIIVIPDDVLHYVPYEVLLTGIPDSEAFTDLPYLVRRSAIAYEPSSSIYLELKQNRREGSETYQKEFLAFGDPDFGGITDNVPTTLSGGSVRSGLADLPFSRVEVETIADLFSTSGTDVFLGGQASEASLKSTGLTNYRFVHFATHGIVDERRPDFSGLALARSGESGEDGFLQAAEIFGLRMRPELLVLSACETGLGKIVRGEGVVGLTRAFMYAGASTIIVSLWRVADESTSELMQRLYAEMIEGENDKAAALQRAKLSLAASAELAHPFYWAPFVMVGDPH